MEPASTTSPSIPPAPATPVSASPATLILTWPKSAQMALGLLLAACLFFMLGRWSTQSYSPFGAGDNFDRTGPCLDLNRATKAELRLLPGLGESLAQRVVDYRQRRGAFRDVEELRQVNGIGAKTLDRLRPWLFVSHETSVAMDDQADPRPVAAKAPAMNRTVSESKKKETPSVNQININYASQTDLQKIPGIGPKISQRILDERAKAFFKSVEDLRRVPGIGAKTLEKMRPYVMIEEARPVVATAEE